MPDFGGNQEPSLDDIRRSDGFIDALAGGLPLESGDQADAALAAILGSWRDENRWPPDTGLISEPQAIAALDAGLAEKRSGPKKWAPTASPTTATPRNRRGLSVVGAAAAAMLAVGGFGAVVAGSGPGDALYGMRTMLFGAPKQVRDDQVALAARTEMQQVQELISRGDWQQAEQKLVAVSNQVAGIADEQQKQELLDQFNNLSAKVVERDPEATPPPGITYTVPPSATELVPAVATRSSTTNPSGSSETEPATTSPASASSPSTTPTSVPSTTPTSVPSTSPTAAATTSAAATSAPSTSAPSTAASSSTAQSSAASSTAASSSAAPSTTATQQTPTSAATTTAPASAAATSTTTAPAKSAATSATTSAPAAAATTTSAPAAAATTTTAPPVTTTATPATSAAPAKTAPATTSPAAAATSGMTTAGGAAPAQAVTPATTTVVIPLPVPAG